MVKLTTEKAKEVLEQAGEVVEEQKRLPSDLGDQIILVSGLKVSVFDTGKFAVQPRNKEIEEALRTATGNAPAKKGKPALKKQVFVVYGHDPLARSQLDAMLRRWGLEPLILDQLPSEGQTIIEKLDHYIGKVDFGVVLATPDDQGHRADRGDEIKHRARQNVVLELGMLLAKLGRPKVAILMKKPGIMERPSDIQGLIYHSFTDDLEKEAGLALAKEMDALGYDIPLAKV